MTAASFALLCLACATFGWRSRSGRYGNGPVSFRRRRQLAAAAGTAGAASAVLAIAGAGWFGLIAWIGFVPVAAGATMLAFAYGPASR